jgi:C-terminal processing protease CtpA/Prc
MSLLEGQTHRARYRSWNRRCCLSPVMGGRLQSESDADDEFFGDDIGAGDDLIGASDSGTIGLVMRFTGSSFVVERVLADSPFRGIVSVGDAIIGIDGDGRVGGIDFDSVFDLASRGGARAAFAPFLGPVGSQVTLHISQRNTCPDLTDPRCFGDVVRLTARRVVRKSKRIFEKTAGGWLVTI